MILLDKPKLRFLLAGRTITTTVPHDRYRKGRSYAVGVRHNRTVCRAEVLAIEENGSGWLVEIRQARELEPLRYLARNPGAQRTDYVSEPSGGARGELPAVDRKTQAKLSELGTLRWKQELEYRESIRAGAALHDRLHDLERAHARGELDASRQLAAIRRRIEALEAKRRQRAA